MTQFKHFVCDADQVFEKGLGSAGIANGEDYYNPWQSIDKRTDMGAKLFEKASISTTTGGAGTAGYATIPVYVDPVFVDQSRKLTPLIELIPRRATRGITYDYVAISAKGGANFKLEDASQADDVDTMARASVSIKYLYAVGRVTGQSIAGRAGFNDALSSDLALKIASMKEAEENEVINGNTSTDAAGYQGLIQTITTNTTDKAGLAVTLENIRDEFATTFNARGQVSLCVTDAATHNYVKGLLQDFQRQPAQPADGLPFGIPGAFEFDGVNFIKSMFMPTSSASRRILFLDMRYLFMAVLQDMTYEELAKVNDSQKYMLKIYEAMVLTYEGACSQIYGIL